MATPDVRIVAWSSCPDTGSLALQLDAIFFDASATKSFADEAARAAFRERWLGRYLMLFPEGTFLALASDGAVLGYVCGSTRDPARDPAFEDIGYFAMLAALTERYPAHLHINLAEGARNRGIGGQLIEAFVAHARGTGAGGVHVVTSAVSRNRTFYDRQGFRLIATQAWNGHDIVMLGRRLDGGG